MNELKCKECGATLTHGTTECPSCGCPIAEAKSDQVMTFSEKKPPKINPMSIVSLVLGIVIMIMGVTVMNKKVNIDTYTAKHYDADSAAFGGDFYTEIYGASDIIVDELSDINGGVELLSESMASMSNIIYYPIGMLIVAFGIGVISVSLIHIKSV